MLYPYLRYLNTVEEPEIQNYCANKDIIEFGPSCKKCESSCNLYCFNIPK